MVRESSSDIHCIQTKVLIGNIHRVSLKCIDNNKNRLHHRELRSIIFRKGTHILSYSKTLSVGLVWGLFEICQAFPSEDEQHRVAFLMTLDLYPGFK